MKLTFKSLSRSTLALTFAFALSSCSSTPTAGNRFKTQADVLDEIMRTKDISWLRANLGEPHEIDKQYKDYVIWRWNSYFRNHGEKVPCAQSMALDKKDQLVGWTSDCDPNAPGTNYGEIAATTPIPKSVVPADISKIIQHRHEQQEAKAESERTRVATFADYLATRVGMTEENIYGWYKNISSTDKLSSGKVIRTYYIEWSSDNGFIFTEYDCKFSLSFMNGKVVGYDAGNCSNAWPGSVKATKVHYTKPEAPWSNL